MKQSFSLVVTSKYNRRGPSVPQLVLLKGYNIDVWNCLIIIDDLFILMQICKLYFAKTEWFI